MNYVGFNPTFNPTHMNKVYVKVQIDPNNNRKTKPSKSGLYPVYIMVKQVRKKERIKLNIPNIRVEDFQDVYGKWVKKSVTNNRIINSTINQAIQRIEEFILLSAHQKRHLTPKEVKNWYQINYDSRGFMKNGSDEFFHDFFEKYTDKLRINKCIYKNTLAKLNAFGLKVSFSEFKRDYVNKLITFLLEDPTNKVHETSAKLYFSKIKKVYKEWCLSLQIDFDNRIFEGFRFKSSPKKQKYALSWDELKKLEKMEFGDSKIEKVKESVRDVFLFMCYTSRYFEEIKKLNFEENFFWEGPNNDLPVIKGKRPKTNEYFEIPLLPKIVEDIFWRNNPLKKGEFFPELKFRDSSVSMMYHLEKFSEELGLKFKMTIITARYTFASTVSDKLPRSITQKMMGHKSIKTQEIYVAQKESFYKDVEDHWKKNNPI